MDANQVIECCGCGEYHSPALLQLPKAHHCPEWDFMFITERDPEMECCTCKFTQ